MNETKPRKRKLRLIDPIWEDLSEMSAMAVTDLGWQPVLLSALRSLALKVEALEKQAQQRSE